MKKYPLTTGEAARMLGTTEPELAETVRRGHVNPVPLIMSGRRLWMEDHVVQAREALRATAARKRKREETK